MKLIKVLAVAAVSLTAISSSASAGFWWEGFGQDNGSITPNTCGSTCDVDGDGVIAAPDGVWLKEYKGYFKIWSPTQKEYVRPSKFDLGKHTLESAAGYLDDEASAEDIATFVLAAEAYGNGFAAATLAADQSAPLIERFLEGVSILQDADEETTLRFNNNVAAGKAHHEGINGSGIEIALQSDYANGFEFKHYVHLDNLAPGAKAYQTKHIGNNKTYGHSAVVINNSGTKSDLEKYLTIQNNQKNWNIWNDRQLIVGNGSSSILAPGLRGNAAVAAVAGAAALVTQKFDTKNYETRRILLDTRSPGRFLNVGAALSPRGGLN
jgi:hypothetical protein